MSTYLFEFTELHIVIIWFCFFVRSLLTAFVNEALSSKGALYENVRLDTFAKISKTVGNIPEK